MATSAQADFWDNCTAYGGTIITANSYGNDKSGGLCNDPSNPELTNNCNGKRFCLNSNTTNWWSAFAWCESIGGRLASFESICPGVQTNPNNTTGACPNAKGTGNRGAWTKTGWKNTNAFAVNLSSGAVFDGYRDPYNGYWQRALCEE